MKLVTLKPVRTGDTKIIKLTIRDAITNDVVDVSGDSFYFTLKDDKDVPDASAALQVNYTAPANATSAGGVVLLRLSPANTVNLTPGSYHYDITWASAVSSPGDRRLIQQGTVSVVSSVTRAQP